MSLFVCARTSSGSSKAGALCHLRLPTRWPGEKTQHLQDQPAPFSTTAADLRGPRHVGDSLALRRPNALEGTTVPSSCAWPRCMHGEGTDPFLRAMLKEGPFPPSSRYGYLNALTPIRHRSSAQSGPSAGPRPDRFRKRKHVCKRPDCPFIGTDVGCAGGRDCERWVDSHRSAAPCLDASFIGPIDPWVMIQ